MQLKKLKSLLETLDKSKKLSTFDSLQTKILREFVVHIEKMRSDTDEVTINELEIFAKEKGYDLDLSPKYLESDSEATQLFIKWIIEDINVKPLKLDLASLSAHLTFSSPVVTIKTYEENISFGFNAILPSIEFNSQPAHKKNLPSTRFWNRPTSLAEQCIQIIASALLRDPMSYDRSKIPADLNEHIDQRLNDAQKQISQEKIVELVPSSVL